ncbi:MAG: secondary thiamine-phosphate synthase enzyme YjbQ [Planctomyces sp.]|jgi:secondary thiamine-phosphate synthase enzyme|nr:secondary thiamine-phosphate synthase enzyme YjbQ [Planctomyces sp.]
MTVWIQRQLLLPEMPRGCHLITASVIQELPELTRCRVGLLHIFIQHTSASLTINENADPDVRTDLNQALNLLAPENARWTHTCEGPDDMPAHVKHSLMGASLSIPVADHKLLLGTWQGICLCEHRNRGGRRNLILTLHGELESR